MTEAEWLMCPDPRPMLEFIRERASERKWRLYRCAVCRHIAHLLYSPASQRAVEVAERFADGNADQEELDEAAYWAESPTFGCHFEKEFWDKYPDQDRGILQRLVEMGALSESVLRGGDWRVNEAVVSRLLAAADVAYGYCRPDEVTKLQEDWPGPWLCHCVFANPFLPPPAIPPAVLAWSDGTVRRIAEGIYEERAFGRLPILADALLDAGCDNEELIQHCRNAGPHVRGCWALDLILGKS